MLSSFGSSALINALDPKKTGTKKEEINSQFVKDKDSYLLVYQHMLC